MPQSLRNRINLQRHEDPRKALMILLRFLCWAACALLALMSDAKTQRTYVEQNKLLLWCKKAQKQEPIKWSLHLPYKPLESTLSRVDL